MESTTNPKLSVESKPYYIIPLKVSIADTDMFRHINNVAYIGLMESARVDFFMGIGCNLQKELAITRSLTVDYLAQASFFDPLAALILVTKIGTTSMELEIDIVNAKDHSKVYTKSRVVQIHCCPKTGQPMPVSDYIRDKIREIGQA